MKMNKIIFVFMIYLFLSCQQQQPNNSQEKLNSKSYKKNNIIGKLQLPLGTVVTLQGVITEGPSKGYEGGPNIQVYKINGISTQEDIQIKLNNYYWGEIKDVRSLKYGESYEMIGYESGDFVGMPKAIYKEYAAAGTPIQTSGFHLRIKFEIYKVKKIDGLITTPADFIDKTALISGRAINLNKKAYIESNNWKLFVDPNKEWPDFMIDREVEGKGLIRKTTNSNLFTLENGKTKLVRLEDQINRNVELGGTAWSQNGDWWFDYRGTTVYVENMNKLPNWNIYIHGCQILIKGKLEEKVVSQYHPRSEKKEAKSFYISSPSWEPIDALLTPEKSK